MEFAGDAPLTLDPSAETGTFGIVGDSVLKVPGLSTPRITLTTLRLDASGAIVG